MYFISQFSYLAMKSGYAIFQLWLTLSWLLQKHSTLLNWSPKIPAYTTLQQASLLLCTRGLQRTPRFCQLSCFRLLLEMRRKTLHKYMLTVYNLVAWQSEEQTKQSPQVCSPHCLDGTVVAVPVQTLATQILPTDTIPKPLIFIGCLHLHTPPWHHALEPQHLKALNPLKQIP